MKTPTAVAVALAMAALTLAACSSSPAKPAAVQARTTTSTTSTDPSTTVSTDATDPTAAPETTTPVGIVLTVTGTSPAGQVTVDDNGSIDQHTGIALPFTTTLTDNPTLVGVGGQTASSSPAATITCTIAVPGQAPTTHTSTGAYAVVDCSADTAA